MHTHAQRCDKRVRRLQQSPVSDDVAHTYAPRLLRAGEWVTVGWRWWLLEERVMVGGRHGRRRAHGVITLCVRDNEKVVSPSAIFVLPSPFNAPPFRPSLSAADNTTTTVRRPSHRQGRRHRTAPPRPARAPALLCIRAPSAAVSRCIIDVLSEGKKKRKNQHRSTALLRLYSHRRRRCRCNCAFAHIAFFAFLYLDFPCVRGANSTVRPRSTPRYDAQRNCST